jgi:23S rRNA (guanosine2251-2'-O)-methyltransferase
MIGQVTNLVRVMDELKSRSVWVVGLEQTPEASDYRTTDLNMPLALVIGSEGQGLRRLVRERCDLLIELPMRGNITSLNASVAGSIALYEAWQQRQNT